MSWLDENDPIFAKLGLWMGAGGDDEQLISLQEAMMRLTSPGQSEKERGLVEKFWEWQEKLDNT